MDLVIIGAKPDRNPMILPPKLGTLRVLPSRKLPPAVHAEVPINVHTKAMGRTQSALFQDSGGNPKARHHLGTWDGDLHISAKGL